MWLKKEKDNSKKKDSILKRDSFPAVKQEKHIAHKTKDPLRCLNLTFFL